MDSLYRKIGYPPYRLDLIQPLLDEASALISNPEKDSAQYRDTAIQIAESLEALTWLVEFDLPKSFPQFAVTPEPVAVEQLATRANVYVSRTERDILDSIGPKALQVRCCLLDGPRQPSRISRPTLGTAQLCQCCKWPFQQLAREPTRQYLKAPGRFWDRQSHDLVAIDDWPALPLLEERSLQGCDFCLFLREHLLSPFVGRSEASDGERVHVWIRFWWGADTRFPRWVEVILRGHPSFSGKSLYLNIDTTNGECDRSGLRVKIKG